jgi:hypothetical protein
MTCIVGLVSDGIVYMGGDSASVSGWDMGLVRYPKVFAVGNFLMGITGHPRFRHILKYHLVIPDHPDGMSLEEYIVLPLTGSIREAAKAAGYAKKENERESIESDVLIGYRGELFELQGSQYQVIQTTKSYHAVGCGNQIALGSLYSTEGVYVSSQARVLRALEASAEFNMGVRGPFHVEVLVEHKKPEEKA